jgi:HlyD family secretion protein
VIAPGQAVVLGQPRPVQTLDGGIIAEIAVANGDAVEEGALLMRLDPTMLATNLGIAETRLATALATRARLVSEQQGLAQPLFAYPDLPVPLPSLAEAEAAQSAIFAARAALRAAQTARTAEAVAQIDAQIVGTRGQIAALDSQAALLAADLANLQALATEGLVRQSQITEAERGLAVLAGEQARLSAEAARLATARRDAELAGAQALTASLEEIVSELRATTAEIDELTLEIVTRRAALDRIAVRAPVAGVVHNLHVAMPGEVLAPGATALEIIPLAEGIEFEIRVDPRAIDQVHAGQTADLVLSAFDPQSTPKLRARVVGVPADVTIDPQTGAHDYRVTLRLDPGEQERLAGQQIRPGMPVDAYLATGSHSVLAYLLDPVRAHLDRAFRE